MADKAMELDPNLLTDFTDGFGRRKDLFYTLEREKGKSTVTDSILGTEPDDEEVLWHWPEEIRST